MATRRQIWIDNCKGLSMLLVVLLHVSGWYQRGTGLGDTFWLQASEVLVPLRMPLFFMISGMLVHRALATNARKVLYTALSLYSVYVFWSIIHAARLIFFPEVSPQVAFGPELILWNLLSPGLYWYIWALPVYYLLTLAIFALRKDASRYPAWLLGICLATLVASGFSREVGYFWATGLQLNLHMEMHYAESVVRNFTWFFLGAVFAPLLMARGQDLPRSGRWAVVLGLLCMGIGLVIGQLDARLELLVAPFILVVGAAVLMARFETGLFPRFCGYIGSRTLPIYIFHWLLLNVMTLAIQVLYRPEDTLSYWAGLIWPVVLSLGVILVCLALDRLIYRCGLGLVLEGVPRGLPKLSKRLEVPRTAT